MGPLPILVTVRSGQFTATLTTSEVAAVPFVGVAVALLLSVPHEAAVETAVTWTLALPPLARAWGPQVSVPPVMEQPVAVVFAASMVQAKLPGRLSVMTTPLASPGPALVTVMVKPTVSPALTDAASAVLVMLRLGHCTVMTVAGVVAEPSLLVVTEAVLVIVPQAAGVVGAVTVTALLPPVARLPKLQVSVL